MPAERSGSIDFWSDGIDSWRDGIDTRGVLYDVPRFRGADFEAVADKCAELGRWEFQYVCYICASLVLRYGTGSPVSPLAVM